MNKFESLSIVWVFTEPAIYEEQVSMPLPTALTHIHFVTACECLLLILAYYALPRTYPSRSCKRNP